MSSKINIIHKVAFEICRNAIWHNEKCTILVQKLESYNKGIKEFKIQSADNSFYSGLSGITFFLLSYLKVQPNEILKKTAIGFLKQIIYNFKNQKSDSFDFWVGGLGIAYTLHYAGDILENQRWKNESQKILNKTIQITKSDWKIDVIDGVAGAIPILIYFHELYPLLKLDELAIAAGQFLKQSASKETNGISWKSYKEQAHPNLGGFAHGVSGIANALLDIYKLTNNIDFLNIAKEAIKYENTLYSSKENNWGDLRNYSRDNEQISYPCFWCHGASGIGISRDKVYSITKENIYKNDIQNIIQNIISNNNVTSLKNYSLCHGQFGNLMILRSLKKHATELNKVIDKEISQSIDAFHDSYKQGYDIPSDNLEKDNGYDFMLGKAGVSYFLLTELYPNVFPTIIDSNYNYCFRSNQTN